jgi:PleD family two-component response regulator
MRRIANASDRRRNDARGNGPALRRGTTKRSGGAVRSKRVLILDDDRGQVPRLRDCFARFHHGCQYDVVAAATASETVTALTEGRPDLIIIEPETDGFDSLEIVSKLRRHDQTIPIIAASRGTKRAVVDAIFRLGLFAYIPKPIDYLPLEHLVAMACRVA